MTADLTIPVLLTDILPRWASLSELRLGDLVKFGALPKPVTITASALEDTRHVFDWILVEADGTISEGRGVHDVEQVLLIARAEQVPAEQVRRGNVLVFDDRDSAYGLVADEPTTSRRGVGIYEKTVVAIAWRSGSTPHGMPRTIGFLQRDPSDMLRRALRGWEQ